MAIIALENIRKSYADGNQMHHVLNQLNLSVEPNEFVAILGPSRMSLASQVVTSGPNKRTWGLRTALLKK